MEKKIKPCIADEEVLKKRFLALRDSIDIFSGKWRFRLLITLYYYDKLRFTDFLEVMVDISPKVLTAELVRLEEYQLVTKVLEYTPTQDIAYYKLTEHAHEMWAVLNTLIEFGLSNRQQIIKARKRAKSV